MTTGNQPFTPPKTPKTIKSSPQPSPNTQKSFESANQITRIFEKFKIKNEENDFVINQLDGLKDKYREEKAKMPLEKMDNPMKYMEKFQDFSKPPILPPEANNQEYYRPNPAVYQRKLNANPYVVDVGLSKVDNPVYANFPKLDTIDVRANSRFYNMETNQVSRNDVDSIGRERVMKPFSNVKIEKFRNLKNSIFRLFLIYGEELTL